MIDHVGWGSGLSNRPGVAGAVLQSPPSQINWLIHSFTDPLVKISFKLSQSWTGRAREVTFWENVHATLCAMCHVSCVICHMSHVTYHLSHVTCHLSKYFFLNIIFDKKFKLSLIFFDTLVELVVEGLLSTEPTPSSFFVCWTYVYFVRWLSQTNKKKGSIN